MNKRDAILAATSRLLALKGFHGFSIKQVADEAGVATGTVYLYFNDREHLIEELHNEMVGRVIGEVSEGHDCNLPLFEQFQCIFRSFWQLFLRDPDILMSRMQFEYLPSECIQRNAEEKRKNFTPLASLFHRGVEQGILKPLPDDILFSLGLEPCFTLARKHIRGCVPIDDATLEQIIRASWDCICVSPTPEAPGSRL